MHSDFSKGIESEEFIELLDKNEQKMRNASLAYVPTLSDSKFPFYMLFYDSNLII